MPEASCENTEILTPIKATTQIKTLSVSPSLQPRPSTNPSHERASAMQVLKDHHLALDVLEAADVVDGAREKPLAMSKVCSLYYSDDVAVTSNLSETVSTRSCAC